MASPIKIAHDLGVQAALKEAGYASVEEVTKEAAELGLLGENQQTSQATKTAEVDPNALSELQALLK